jgi:glutathione S-transferase
MKLLMNTTSPYARTAYICLLEKGFEPEVQIVNPWADDEDLLKANTAARVPALILDDGRALTESLLIALWAEAERPEPSLVGDDADAVVSAAGVAMGIIDAAVHTLVGRLVSDGDIKTPKFDEAPVGQRRRRSMINGFNRLDEHMGGLGQTGMNLAVATAIVALDYVNFRFPDAPWMPEVPNLRLLRSEFAEHPSIANTVPHE